MAGYVLKNPKIYMDGANISGRLNKIELSIEADELDSTNFNSSGKEYAGGNINTEFNYSGYVVAGGTSEIDPLIFDYLTNSSTGVLTVCPTNGTTGEIAYSMPIRTFEFKYAGEIGQLLKFDVKAKAQDVPINGTIIFSRSVNTSGNATAFDFGTFTTDQPLYGTLHVISRDSSGSFVATIESACSSGFATPTERIVFTPSSEVGSQMLTASPSCAEHKFYRVVYGSSDSAVGCGFSSVIAFAIGK